MTCANVFRAVCDELINPRPMTGNAACTFHGYGVRERMVFVFFCVSGVLGPIQRHLSLTTREDALTSARSLDADMLALANALERFPGAVIVVGNDWPLLYDIETVRTTCSTVGRRIVNGLNVLSDTREQAVLDFMSTRPEPYLVVASSDFEFSEITRSKRIDINCATGFDYTAQSMLVSRLHEIGYFAIRPVTGAEMLGAMSSGRQLERARRFAAALYAAQDEKFQVALQSLLGEGT